MPDALTRVVGSLRCPVCGGPLRVTATRSPTRAPTRAPTGPSAPPAEHPAAGGNGPAALGCPSGHRFDVARQGHVALVAGGSRLRSDTAEMVAARTRVLGSGAFAAVTSALVGAVAGAEWVAGVAAPGVEPALVVDLGAGTGHHTIAVLDVLADHAGIALELSTPALRVAGRVHPRLAAVGADLTQPLPLADDALGAHSVVMAVFAPLPSPDELQRVTGPGCLFVVVTPTTGHLARLRDRLGLMDVPAGKTERLARRLGPGWSVVAQTPVAVDVTLDRATATDVVLMGPNAWHVDDRLRRALEDLPDQVDDVISVTVTTFVRQGPAAPSVSRWRPGERSRRR